MALAQMSETAGDREGARKHYEAAILAAAAGKNDAEAAALQERLEKLEEAER